MCPRDGSSCSSARRRVPRRALAWSTCSASPRSTCSADRIGEDGLRALLDERVTIVDGDFSRGVPRASRRHRHRDPFRRDGRVRPADRRGVPDQPVRRHEPVPGRDRERVAPVPGAHLDGVRRRRRQGRRPRGHVGPSGGLADGGRARAAGAARRGGTVAASGDARRLHGQGVEGTFARRPDGGGRGRRAAAQGLGVEAPDALRPVARPLARMARRLHVHEGDGRTGRRGARGPRGPAVVDRSPVDHRERAGASRARVDRRVQDGRPDHPRVRLGSDPGVPRHPGGDLGHHPGGHGGERDPGGRGHAAAAPQPRVLPRQLGQPEPAPVPRAVSVRAPVLRGPSVAGARTRRAQGARVVVPGQPERRAIDRPSGAADRHRRHDRHAPAEVEADARPGLPRGSRQGPRRLREALLGSVRRVHRGRGHLHRRPHARAVGLAHTRGPGRGSRSMRRSSTGGTTCRTCTHPP